MTPEQIALVQGSFRQLAPLADDVARDFYQRLFEIDPGLRRLFPQDMSAQRAKLMQMIAAAVAGLSDLRGLVPAVQALGRRHAGYGVQPAHYAAVGQALIDTLRAGLGAGFTPAAQRAWSAVYETLAATMQAAAEPVGQPA
jgi:nitric oxide dioxygenase